MHAVRADAPAPASASANPAAHTDAPSPRRRDAAETRRLLLAAALYRFATQGYADTTVREIADDAGVNAALISRYFDSKEGLFEECLTGVSTELGTSTRATSLDEVAASMAEQLAGPYTREHPNRLVLLLRTSGDARAERIRLETLRTYSLGLVTAGGGSTDGPGAEQRLLRAQLALSVALGVALMRSATVLEPLASADRGELVGPLKSVLHALLAPEPLAAE
jgi:AcrR family transcriptional regulator